MWPLKPQRSLSIISVKEWFVFERRKAISRLSDGVYVANLNAQHFSKSPLLNLEDWHCFLCGCVQYIAFS